MDKTLQKLDDLWESSLAHEIVESASEVDGVHVLAKVRGPAFFPDTTSGNKTFYPLEAWENAINEERFQQRLLDRLVYGTIGHGQVINDDAIKDGKFSHLVTKVFIDESGVGQAEYLILNTPTGQILNTVLRAKSKLRVSTKAKGIFENQSSSGQKSVNPKVFFLERIDFVLDPGYDQALPELIESLNKDSEEGNHLLNKENTMSNVDPTQKLVEVLESSITGLKEDGKVALSTIADLNQQLGAVKTEIKVIQESREDLEAKCNELEKQLADAKAELKKFDDLGTPEQVSEALDKSLVTIDRMQKTINKASAQIAESLIAEEVNEELKKYREFGTLSELNDLVEHADKLADRYIQDQLESLQAKYGVSKEVITKLHKQGLDVSAIEESLSMILTEKKTIRKPSTSLSTKDFRREINESKIEKTGEKAVSLSRKLLRIK